ncbi:MAG TPA: signal peptidase I [Polyangiaceae bacterium]|nr:signal peptidase I [Polyangiaceae bacterium]
MKSKLLHHVFWPLWFAVIPLALATLTVSLLAPSEGAMPDGPLGQLRFLVGEQKVPAIILFFVLYEGLFYQLRYSLPLAERMGMAGRKGLPRNRRREYEHAGQLLDEMHEILRKNRKQVDERLTPEARAELMSSLERLSAVMAAPDFEIEGFDRAYEEALVANDRHLKPWHRSELREYGESIFIAVGVALMLRAFLIEAFKIPSGSMLPTLQIQDHIFVNKFTYGPTIPFANTRLFAELPPERGDIVVFEYPDPNPRNPRQDFIKRVIALPGDILEAENGHPIINGWPVPNCRVGDYRFSDDFGMEKGGDLFIEYLGDETYLTLYETRGYDDVRQGPFRVGPGEFYVMGDNRNNSQDSRLWRNGQGAGVPFDNVKGRAMFVWLSFNNLGRDALGVTWDRLFTNVMGHPRLPKEAPFELTAGIERCLQPDARPATTVPPSPAQAELTVSR